MFAYIVHRSFLIIPTLLGVSVIIFLVLELVPGDPALLLLGENASAEQLTAIRQRMGLDKPVVIRYLNWLGGVVQGNFGTSLADGRDVLQVAISRLPSTLKLLVASVGLSLCIGIPLGILSASFPNGLIDFLARVVALIGLSIPNFWLALLLIMVFSYNLRWLPISGAEGIEHLVLPAVTLGTTMSALIMRLTRTSVLEELGQDYVRTARGKGVSGLGILYKHALRNAVLPIVTMVGLNVGFLLGGSVIVESIFEWPGMGNYAYLKMMQRDYPAILANLVIFALLFSVINLLTDLAYGLFDPRVRYD